MPCTINEAPVIKLVERLALVEVIYEVCMFACNANAHLACSPDGVELVNTDDEFVKGDNDIQIENSSLCIFP